MVAELTVVGGAEARNGRGHGGDSDLGHDDVAAAAPCVRLHLSVRVPQVTALKMELSRVTGSAGSPLVRSGAARDAASLALRNLARALTPRAPRVPPRQSPSVAEVVGGGCELEARAHASTARFVQYASLVVIW